MSKQIVKVINKSINKLPQYETPYSAGMDVRADLEHTVSIAPGERLLIPTGLYVEIPIGYEIQVRGRSGLALKHGITIAQGIGTIDSDYRGELGVILINHGFATFDIAPGERIGQLVLNKVEQIQWEVTTDLTDTIRGEGGFGSTGK